jgi:hypothetical protein
MNGPSTIDMPYHRKTTRVYGQLIATIRDHARLGKPFTWRDIPPGGRVDSVKRLLLKMSIARELTLLKPGVNLGNGKSRPAVWAARKLQ